MQMMFLLKAEIVQFAMFLPLQWETNQLTMDNTYLKKQKWTSFLSKNRRQSLISTRGMDQESLLTGVLVIAFGLELVHLLSLEKCLNA